VLSGKDICESPNFLSSEAYCKASSCCQWNASCSSSIGNGVCPHVPAITGAQFCESLMVQSNRAYCQASPCCHWNTGASQSDKGYCQSAIGNSTCYRIPAVSGATMCESVHQSNEAFCRAISCCRWVANGTTEVSNGGQGRCRSAIGDEICDLIPLFGSVQLLHTGTNTATSTPTRSPTTTRSPTISPIPTRPTITGEEFCQGPLALSNEVYCNASSCCHWNTQEAGEASNFGKGRCWSSVGNSVCRDIPVLSGKDICESPNFLSSEAYCKASSCCQWNASCSSSIGNGVCSVIPVLVPDVSFTVGATSDGVRVCYMVPCIFVALFLWVCALADVH